MKGPHGAAMRTSIIAKPSVTEAQRPKSYARLTIPIMAIVAIAIVLIVIVAVTIAPAIPPFLVTTIVVHVVAAVTSPPSGFVTHIDDVAVLRCIDFHWYRLRHGLARHWHGKNDASRNCRYHGQCFDAEHNKVLL